MTARPGLFLLASYPKSGNTWVRCLLAALMDDVGFTLDGLARVCPNAADRSLFERWTGLDSAHLRPDEIDSLWPAIYRQLAVDARAPRFLKVHDRLRLGERGEPIFPADALAGVVHIVRDPADVVPSLADHLGWTLQQAVTALGTPGYAYGDDRTRLPTQLRQVLGSWTEHTESWLEPGPLPDTPRLCVRYEDLASDPQGTLAALADFVGLSARRPALAAAIASCRFERLAAIERAAGFAERSPHAKAFFRSGVVGAGRQLLSADLLATIDREHGQTLRRLGYSRGPGDSGIAGEPGPQER